MTDAPFRDLPDEPDDLVGDSDAQADAVRSGADADIGALPERDTDPVPVGGDDAMADIEKSGADPDDV